jgi:hypothetical protein
MTEGAKEAKSSRFGTSSRLMKTLLLVIAAFLIFVGPSYFVYVAVNVLDLSYAVSMGSGIVLFCVGLVLLWYLVRSKVVS